MTDKINLNAHYTNNQKIEQPVKMVANAPEKLPKRYSFDDEKATMRIRALNKDVDDSAKKEKKSFAKKYLKIFLASLTVILCLFGGKRLLNNMHKWFFMLK